MIGSSYLFSWMFTAYPTFHYFIEALFKVEGIKGTEVLMLPLGFSVGSILNGIMLWWSFDRDFKNFSAPLRKTFFDGFSAAVIMGFITYVSLNPLSFIFNNTTFFGILFQSVCAGAIGIISGIILLKIIKNQEIEEIWKALHSKIWKAKPIGPDPEVTA